MGLISLKKLRKNTPASVVRVDPSTELSQRIRALGIFPGASIEVMNRPLFNDAIMVKVDGCILVMKKSETDCILVETGI